MDSKDDKYTASSSENNMTKAFLVSKTKRWLSQKKFSNFLVVGQGTPHRTTMLSTQISTNRSEETDFFGDNVILTDLKKKELIAEMKNERLKSLLSFKRDKTSTEHYQLYKSTVEQKLEIGYDKMQDDYLHCQAALNVQKQRLANLEQQIVFNNYQLSNYKEQFKGLYESLQLIQGQNSKSLNDLVYRKRLKMFKERKLIYELLEFIRNLEEKYVDHIEDFTDYLSNFRQEINEALIESEYK